MLLWAILAVIVFAAFYHLNDHLRDRRRRAVPKFDRGAGNPHLAPAGDLLWKGDWGGLSALYRKQTPSDRYKFIDALGDTAVVDTALPSDKADSGALCVAGGLKISHAWRFRGYGGASTVSESDAIKMWRCFEEA